MNKTLPPAILTLYLIGCTIIPSHPNRETVMPVEHTENLTAIQGIQGFDSGAYPSSPHGVQAVILNALDSPLTYDDLICYSAFAFRVSTHDQMCPSAAHPCCGFMCIEGSNRALPLHGKFFDSLPGTEPKPDRPAFEAEVCAAVKAGIDRGLPVHYGSEEDGLIIGYADQGRRWWCLHPYHSDPHTPFWHDQASGFAGGQWPWGVAVYSEPKTDDQLTSDRELTIAALQQAVQMWHTEKVGAYFIGSAAYDHWLNWLNDAHQGRIENPQVSMQGNAWCFAVLVHSRKIAGAWLQQKAANFDDPTASHLRRAAEHYTQLAQSCAADFASPWDLALRPERIEHRTPTRRQTQITRLKTARRHDRSAIAEIEKALKSLK